MLWPHRLSPMRAITRTLIRRPMSSALSSTNGRIVSASLPHLDPARNFYRTTVPLSSISCDWSQHTRYNQFVFCVPPKWHNLTKIEFWIHHLFKIEGDIYPLAYLHAGPDGSIFFRAGGKYYSVCAGEFLDCYGSEFQNDDDFLASFSERQGYLQLLRTPFPDDTEEIWEAVDREQRSLADAAKRL
ncbi:hypothetical protein R3P38DRAFT_2666813 [Favolaschia claudopus]|uniref:Uncharacterized protein n=1 Tax=Favolaschia claudopus TaxID=2862362 RepID=A0AAV9ZBZ4_9AGAR